MKLTGVFANWLFLGTVVVILSFWISDPPVVGAQNTCQSAQGNNAVWGTCPAQGFEIVGTPAFLDARAWCGGSCDGADLCDVVNNALNTLQTKFPQGGVVDARGVVPSTGGQQECKNYHDPFAGVTVPSTVLLPPSTILIHVPWKLPSNIRISGQPRQTILLAATDFTLDSTIKNAMIAMGTSAGATSVVVEHLKFDGTTQAACQTCAVGVSGIYNGNAQDGSYVDDVEFYGLGAISSSQSSLTTGLLIDAGAAGSGPYSKITFSGAKSQNCNTSTITCQQTACVQMRAATRGLHGITCATKSTVGNLALAPVAGIYLDASNNTIEDVHSEGFYDAIVVGDNVSATVAANLILNVTGDYGGNSGPTANAIHICGGIQSGACTTTIGQVSDLSVFGAQSTGAGSNGPFQATTIKDDLTGTTINSNAFPTYVGMYVVGEPVGTSQYSRFTTSLGNTNGSSATVPTWAVGSVVPGTTCSTPGALYSNTRGSGSNGTSNTLYLCSGGNWLSISNNP